MKCVLLFMTIASIAYGQGSTSEESLSTAIVEGKLITNFGHVPSSYIVFLVKNDRAITFDKTDSIGAFSIQTKTFDEDATYSLSIISSRFGIEPVMSDYIDRPIQLGTNGYTSLDPIVLYKTDFSSFVDIETADTVLHVRGERPDNSYYYVDGVKVRGSVGQLPGTYIKHLPDPYLTDIDPEEYVRKKRLKLSKK